MHLKSHEYRSPKRQKRMLVADVFPCAFVMPQKTYHFPPLCALPRSPACVAAQHWRYHSAGDSQWSTSTSYALRAACGEAEQATKALETFFDFRRGNLPSPEWSVQWQLNLEEAVTHAGVEVNQVAKTYLFLKSSGLLQKTVDRLDIYSHTCSGIF